VSKKLQVFYKKRGNAGDVSTEWGGHFDFLSKILEGGSSTLRLQFSLVEGILGRLNKCWTVKSLSLLDVILSRRSIRKYEDKEIPQDILLQVLEAGRQAPSAVNRQPIRFVVVTDTEAKNELSKSLFAKHIKNAPMVIVGCADEKSLLTGKWAVVDTTIALQNIVIAAWTFGIGSCWIGSFSEEKVKELLKIPDKWKVVAGWRVHGDSLPKLPEGRSSTPF
jgi:nitroreductase